MLRVARPTPPLLFLLNSLMVGGSETKSIRMANALAARGSDVTVAYLNPPEQLIGEIEPRVRTLHLRRRGKFSVRAWRGLVDAIRTRGTPVVVAMNLYPSLYAALARSWLGRDRFRLLMSVNVTDFVSREHERRMLLYRRVLKRADTVIFGAETQRRLWRERYGIGGDERGPGKEASSVVLYNGVDTDRFAPAARTPAAHRFLRTRYVIGTVGRMRAEKAQHTLVAVTATLRSRGIDVGALLVGDGPERPRILAEIDAHGMQQFVTLAGETKDVRPYLADMDVFVLPSISVETFSNAALEALACGVPVVCSRIGGMEELIGYGGGVSYAAGDVRDLTDVLARLLSDDSERQRLARAARRAAVEHFGWDRMVDRFLSLAAAR
ncbi:MAG TPA: glycosyltransferase family 4 protein [Steroidobacteraceae bacterium]|jgi:glycosyltransferase involved in cell wall biosynthesis|nr:glycosyltransferase family 4 protein [Steroidobacteraceae bacterium]